MANAHPLDVSRLRLLREVGLRGTIAGAARSLGLTASAVSQQLAQLEREAGTPLVDRSPRGAALTGAGRILAERDWVMPPDDAACGLAVRTACRSAGFEARVRWTSDDMLVLARAVAAGHGIAVLPLLSVADEVRGLDVRPLREPRLERRLTA